MASLGKPHDVMSNSNPHNRILYPFLTSIKDSYILDPSGGVGLKCVKVSPQTKEDRVENLRKCLTFLAKRGCDVTLATPSELEDGNLRSSLVLLGNIRKHFQVSISQRFTTVSV